MTTSRSAKGNTAASQTLKAQLASTAFELERLSYRLQKLEAASPALYERYKLVVKPSLDARWGDLREAAQRKETPSPGMWKSFHERKVECDELLSESLDFIQGALIRKAGLDDGLCAIADAMLDDLAYRAKIEWGRLSVPADSEFVSDLAQIVRIRAADASIWHLPVAAHEFGHFIGPLISQGDARPFEKILGELPAASPRWSHAHEFFADTFASFAIGPSFAVMCVASKFDPLEANVVRETHPSHAQRVHLMLRVLERMGHGFDAIRGYILRTWQANVSGAGLDPALDAETDRYVTETADAYSSILFDNLAAIRYSSMNDAQRAKAYILGRWQGDAPVVTIPDVLNGAWLSRIAKPVVDIPGLRLRGQIAFELAAVAARAQSQVLP